MWYINIKNFSCTFYCNLSFLDQIFLIFGPKVPLNTFLGPLESSKKHKIGTNWEFYLYICLYIYIYLYIYIIKVYIFFFQKFWRFPPVLASWLFSLIHLLEMKFFVEYTPLSYIKSCIFECRLQIWTLFLVLTHLASRIE